MGTTTTMTFVCVISSLILIGKGLRGVLWDCNYVVNARVITVIHGGTCISQVEYVDHTGAWHSDLRRVDPLCAPPTLQHTAVIDSNTTGCFNAKHPAQLHIDDDHINHIVNVYSAMLNTIVGIVVFWLYSCGLCVDVLRRRTTGSPPRGEASQRTRA